MKNLLFFSMLFLLFSCQEVKEVAEMTTAISGTITNPKGDKAILTKGSFKTEMAVDAQGVFSSTLKGLEEGIYSLRHARELTELYIVPGKAIAITVDAGQFDETISYSGEAAAESNYLAKKYLNQEGATSNPEALYTKSEADYTSFVQNMKSEKLSFVGGFEGLSKDFMTREKKVIDYEFFNDLQNYQGAHRYFTKYELFKVSEKFLKPLSGVAMDNEADFLSISAYNQLVTSYFMKDNIGETVEGLKAVESPAIKNHVVQQLEYFMKPSSETLDSDYKAILTVSTDEAFNKSLGETYTLYKSLAKGSPSPLFSFEDRSGKTVALEALKGKNVYIDLWATWCGPCKREIPDLKRLESKYHNKNIEFVSISLDKMADKEKWMKMLEEKELTGIQLFSDKDWKSDFVKGYGVKSIPRFILLDDEGMIVSADAPRPSSGKEIKGMIDNLKI